MKFQYPLGATQLDEDEAQDLIPHHITLQSQLNEWEQLNILDAEQWAFSKKRSNILEINFCKTMHLKMFGNTWKWAGRFRKSIDILPALKDEDSYRVKLERALEKTLQRVPAS